MKKLAILVVLLGATMAYADNLPTDGMDNQILYWNAQSTTGSNATWGDPSTIPGLQGPQGDPGLNGTNGVDGQNGTNGVDGQNGVNGTNGTDGKDGAKGDKGDKGKDGANGKNGTNASMDHNLFLNLGAEVRWYDAKHFSLNSGYRHDLRHHNNTVDIAVIQFKIGRSYEERQLEALKKQIKDDLRYAVFLPQ